MLYHIKSILGESLGLRMKFRIGTRYKLLGRVRYILSTVPEWRQGQTDNIEPEKEILPEITFLNLLSQLPVG